MNSPGQAIFPNPELSEKATLRLTALWALLESGLGGLLHAFKLPFTGLIVGGSAVILIVLIAHINGRARVLLRATLLVLIIKALVSPHSPAAAYFAVGFQGVLGYLIFSFFRPGYLSAISFGLLAMLESAAQKLLMLLLFFGKPLWTAVNEWGTWVAERFFPTIIDGQISLSWALVSLYVGIYVVGGLFTGWFAIRVCKALQGQDLDFSFLESQSETSTALWAANQDRPKKSPWKGAAIWLFLGALLGLSIYLGDQASGSGMQAVVYLIRTISIVLIWYFLVAPWLAKLFRKWILKRQGAYSDQLDELFETIPRVRILAAQVWKGLPKERRGLGRYMQWILHIVVLLLTLPLNSQQTLVLAERREILEH